MSRSILLYGDVNVTYRDGSRVWLESMVDVLARIDCQVTLLLKAFPLDGIESFEVPPGCIVEPPSADHRSRGAGMRPSEARGRILELDARDDYDVILTRGFEIARELSGATELSGRLWPYLTDGPGFDPFGTGEHEDVLDRIASSARRVLVQTEDARSVLEASVPMATGKTLLLPPMIPDDVFRAPRDASERTGPLQLVYSGKFARAWKSIEIPALPRRLRERGVDAQLTMIGDKVNHSPADVQFPAEMRIIMSTPDDAVTWSGGVDRAESLRQVAEADLGIGWRDASLDTSLELSTKLLEYAALGVAPVVNRTRAHERLLGEDYPLFVDGDVEETIARGADPALRRSAALQAQQAVRPYRSSACAAYLERCFSSLTPDHEPVEPLPSPRADERLRVLFSSHDFKFAGELIDVLSRRDDIELRIDTWQRLAQHDAESSAADGDWADVILCEWAGHNAVFHSRRKREDQRLIVRFHGFEIRGAWLKDIVVSQVDAFVFVSDFYRREILEKTGWPESRTTVIPNVVDVIDLDREKLPDARFHLGIAGYVPMLKRPDRALDLLEELQSVDRRFTLHIRGRAPWTYPWEWAKPSQRDAYRSLLERVRSTPSLHDHVRFEDFSPDMGSWFRGIGWILSPSVKETFHLAPVEGMASGAVPLVWSRPGAAEIFGEALFEDIDTVASTILNTVNTPGAFERLSASAHSLSREFDMAAHSSSWIDLLDEHRSTPLPLRGVPLSRMEPGESPRSPAQAAAVLDRDLQDGHADGALEIMASSVAVAPHGSHLQERILRLRERSLLLHGLRSGRWIPASGLGALHRPAVGGTEEGILEATEVVPEVSLDAISILRAADALSTRCRRDRPRALRAPVDLAGAIATTITARRLGLELHVPEEVADAVRGKDPAADRDLPGLSAAFLSALDRSAEPVALEDMTIGLIADEFTHRALSSTVRTVSIPRHGWEDVIRENPMDALLVESAWSSPGKDWYRGIAFHGEDEASDLSGILALTRSRGIPTIFWNREDPVHLRSFRIPAAEFDAVLTSDADCIPEYLQTLPSRTEVVASLPFFADPAVFRPEAHTEPPDPAPVAFAGTFYGSRYPERSQELRSILEIAARHGLAIYDRQSLVDGSSYALPEDLAPYSRGGASAAQMPAVHHRHPLHVNVNSVTASPTMFSRRAVEIAASGSVVLSGRGAGVTTVLGDAFPVLVEPKEWEDTLEKLSSDPASWREAAWAQLRTVRRSAASAQSLVLALRIAGLPVRAPDSPRYALLVPASLPGAVEMILSQTVPPSGVAIARDHPDRPALEAAGIRLIDLEAAAADLSTLIDGDGYVGVLAASLPPTHYEDLLLALADGPIDRILLREEPAPGEDPFSLVSSSEPSPAESRGSLYSRRIIESAHDLAAPTGGTTFVWIRGAAVAARPPGAP